MKNRIKKLNDESKSVLINFKNKLVLTNEFDIDLNDAIKLIDTIYQMNWTDIEEMRESIISKHDVTELEKFGLKIIDRYCSSE